MQSFFRAVGACCCFNSSEIPDMNTYCATNSKLCLHKIDPHCKRFVIAQMCRTCPYDMFVGTFGKHNKMHFFNKASFFYRSTRRSSM